MENESSRKLSSKKKKTEKLLPLSQKKKKKNYSFWLLQVFFKMTELDTDYD